MERAARVTAGGVLVRDGRVLLGLRRADRRSPTPACGTCSAATARAASRRAKRWSASCVEELGIELRACAPLAELRRLLPLPRHRLARRAREPGRRARRDRLVRPRRARRRSRSRRRTTSRCSPRCSRRAYAEVHRCAASRVCRSAENRAATESGAMSRESERLPEARHGRQAVEEVGAVPERAAVGHRARGLQRVRRRLELLHATTRRARAPIAGARTASPASPTTSSGSASRSRSGTARTRSSRSGCSA